MKNILWLALLSLWICSCKERKKTAQKINQSQEEIHKDFYGCWVGDIYTAEELQSAQNFDIQLKKVNIVIKKITKDTVLAQRIIAGDIRPLMGKLLDEGGGNLSLILNEPGTDIADGKYSMRLVGDTLIGRWKTFQKDTIKWQAKQFKLFKRIFAYNPKLMLPKQGEYVDWSTSKVVAKADTSANGLVNQSNSTFFRSASDSIFRLNASATLLKEAEVKKLRKLDIEIIRNTIFARHGYAFKKQLYRNFFDPVSWYIPLKDKIEQDLTSLEKQNIKLLDRFIKFAQDNYDVLGREVLNGGKK